MPSGSARLRARRAGLPALIMWVAAGLLTPGAVAADGLPDPPKGVGAEVSTGQYGATWATVTVTWHQPDTGPRPDRYWVKYWPASDPGAWQSCYAKAQDSSLGPHDSCVLPTTLQTGQPYLIDVKSGLGYPTGYSPTAAEIVFTPVTPPGPVRNPAALSLGTVSGMSVVQVSWDAPDHDGGGAISGYRVISGIVECATTTLLACVLQGMTPGSTQQITVWARNSAGYGQWVAFDYTVPVDSTPAPTPNPTPAPTPNPTAEPTAQAPTQAAPNPTPTPAQPTAGDTPAPTTESSFSWDLPPLRPEMTPLAWSVATPSPGAGVAGATGGPSDPSAPPGWLLALIGASAAGAVVVVLLRRRKKREPAPAG